MYRWKNTDRLNEPKPEIKEPPKVEKVEPKEKESEVEEPIIIEELVADDAQDGKNIEPEPTDSGDSTAAEQEAKVCDCGNGESLLCKGEFTSCDDCCNDHMGVVRWVDSNSVDPTWEGEPADDAATDSSEDEVSEVLEDDSIATRIKTEKVTHYYNGAYAYGMLIPYGNYYSGFGPQDDAGHTVWFLRSGIPDTLADADVRVYFYGKTILPELENSSFYQDPETSSTYLKLANEFSVKIESPDLEDDTLLMIIETIYVGPNQEPEEEVEDTIEDNEELTN